MRTVLQSTPNGAAPTAIHHRADSFVIRQGVGESQQSIVILSRPEAVELVTAMARQLADSLHDLADAFDGTAFHALTEEITE